MSYILTFDIGTTSVKTGLFDRELSLISKNTEEYELITKPGNMVEVKPQTYIDAVVRGVTQVASAEILAQVEAICVTTQGETLIPVDRQGTALMNAFVWMDTRAGDEAAYIASLPITKNLNKTTGIAAIDGTVPLSKLLWIKNHAADIYEKTYKFLLLEDYILFYLSGQFITNRGIMCTTGYYDIRNDQVYQEMMDALELDARKIPEVRPCGQVMGTITPKVAAALQINPKAVVVTGAMDQIASAVGGGNIVPGVVSETTGTCMVVGMSADLESVDKAGNMMVYTHAVPEKYIILNLCNTAGIILKWFKDEFCIEQVDKATRLGLDVYDILGQLAEEAPMGANGLFLIPYLNGIIQPENVPAMRGAFFGMGLDTKKAEFVRAMFEGIGYMLRESIDMLEQAGAEVAEVRSFGGGARSAVWLQIKADICGKPVAVMTADAESASLGVAILAARALGWYADIEEVCAKNKIKRVYKPDSERHAFYNKAYKKYQQAMGFLKKMYD